MNFDRLLTRLAIGESKPNKRLGLTSDEWASKWGMSQDHARRMLNRAVARGVMVQQEHFRIRNHRKYKCMVYRQK